jgi:hypothetical protein
VAQFQALADVPIEAEWFANLGSAQTRRAYQNDLKSFMAFAGIGWLDAIEKHPALRLTPEQYWQTVAQKTLFRTIPAFNAARKSGTCSRSLPARDPIDHLFDRG